MYLVILDDAEMNNLLVSEALQDLEGIELRTFTEPAAALDFAVGHRCQIALFIVDYDMPLMNGIELTRCLLQHKELAFTPIVMITSFDQKSLRRNALDAGVTDFLSKPFDPFEIRARVRNLLALNRARVQEQNRATWLAGEVAEAVRVIEDREREIVTRLVTATEHRDKDTGLHVQRVSLYVELIAKQLGMEASECRAFALASTMHDVGKIAVSDSILFKQGPLNPEERAIICRHAEVGFAMLDGSSVRIMQLAAQIALSHHERWDGAGYPHGLAGADIPLSGRITAIADVFDALVSDRPYKKEWSLEEARHYVIDQAGRQFDPQCVKAFVDNWNSVEVIAGYRVQGDGISSAAAASAARLHLPFDSRVVSSPNGPPN